TLDGGSVVMKYDTDPILLTGLTDGSHTLYMELVDDSHQPIVPAVNATLNFTTDIIVYPSLPFSDSFSYTVGDNLNDQSNWTSLNSGDEIVVTSGNLSYSGLAGSQGNSISFDGGGLESVLTYIPVTTGDVFSSFIFRVTDQSNVTVADGAYFASLSNSTTSYDARLWVKPAPLESSDFSIGISNTSTPAEISFDSNTYAVGSDVFVVMSYNIETGVINTWINPDSSSFGQASAPTVTITATDASPAASIDKFILRQDSATKTPFITFDELRLGTTWASVTPTTLSVGNVSANTFGVYPNPTSLGYVNISSNDVAPLSVKVFDVLGKQVLNQTLSNNRLDVSSLKSGVYIMKINQNGASVTKKLVIK
ncbi:MAG TPA: T9SS type A sorting domain-containing protein, partial [Aquaticitalea sp.]|nr:T9SS type A sorting domain-containing protein [Aquaticitalea sp.]